MTQPHDENILIMLGGLQKGSDVILKTLSEDREAAARYRTEIRAELAGLRNEYNAVQSDLRLIKDKVEKMEPKVESLERKNDRQQGAREFAISAGSFLKGLAQLAIGAFGGYLAGLFHR